jgi:hypothetical protein
MSDPTLSITACRYCQHYQGEGRRGGQCQQLNVPVQGAWKPCKLAIPPFAPEWEETPDLMLWPVALVPVVEPLSREMVVRGLEQRVLELSE